MQKKRKIFILCMRLFAVYFGTFHTQIDFPRCIISSRLKWHTLCLALRSRTCIQCPATVLKSIKHKPRLVSSIRSSGDKQERPRKLLEYPQPETGKANHQYKKDYDWYPNHYVCVALLYLYSRCDPPVAFFCVNGIKLIFIPLSIPHIKFNIECLYISPSALCSLCPLWLIFFLNGPSSTARH